MWISLPDSLHSYGKIQNFFFFALLEELLQSFFFPIGWYLPTIFPFITPLKHRTFDLEVEAWAEN